MIPARVTYDIASRPIARSSAPTLPESRRAPSPRPPRAEPLPGVDDKRLSWCVDDGESLRAMTMFELWLAISAGEVSRYQLVWREGMECWTPIEDVIELACALPSEDDPYLDLAIEESGIVSRVELEGTTEWSPAPSAMPTPRPSMMPTAVPSAMPSAMPSMPLSIPVEWAPDTVCPPRSDKPGRVCTESERAAAPPTQPPPASCVRPIRVGASSRRPWAAIASAAAAALVSLVGVGILSRTDRASSPFVADSITPASWAVAAGGALQPRAVPDAQTPNAAPAPDPQMAPPPLAVAEAPHPPAVAPRKPRAVRAATSPGAAPKKADAARAPARPQKPVKRATDRGQRRRR